MVKFAATIVFAVVCLATSSRADFPPRSDAKLLDGGIRQYDVHLTGNGPGQALHLLVYLPAGDQTEHSLPCVLVAPAGTNLAVGNAIEDGYTAETLPYVKAGFAAVKYELDGDMPEKPTNAQLFKAVTAFVAAHGGVDDARAAIDYLLARVPEVSPDRIYTAGHSSAATVALDVAAADPRIKACCAYAPCPDLRKRLPARFVKAVAAHVAGFDGFVDEASPDHHVAQLAAKPVLLFSAEDDRNIRTADVTAFADALKAAGSTTCRLVTVPTGGHYQSMIDRGIPAGIEFLKAIDAKAKP